MNPPSIKSHELYYAGIVVVALLCCSTGSVAGNLTNPSAQTDMQQQPVAAGCGDDPVELLPCLPCVTGSGCRPSSSCCSVLRDWGFICLCNFLDDNQANLPADVNQTRIAEVPNACGLLVPPGVKCGGLIPHPPAHSSTTSKGDFPSDHG